MSNVRKNCHERNVKYHPPKPVVIDAKTWNNIVNRGDPTLALLAEEEERKYREYLKTESDKLKSQWPDYVDRNLEKEHPSPEEIRNKKELERMDRARESNKIIKEETEKIRMEKIAKAQNMIQRSKSGPRELDSAVNLSEVMRVREIMTQIKADYQKALDEQSRCELMMLQSQNPSWIEEEQKRMVEVEKRNQEYREELRSVIMEREMEHTKMRKETLELEKRHRQIEEQKTLQQKENEAAALKKKKCIFRNNAEQSKLMSEQRKSLRHMEDKIDDCINEIYNKGKDRIKEILKENDKRVKAERDLRNKLNEQIYFAQIQSPKEITCQGNADFFEKITQNEDVRLQKEKELREQRIQYHLAEVKNVQDLKEIKRENERFERAKQMKNEELQYEFDKKKMNDHQARLKMVKEALLEQIKDKKCKQHYEKCMDQLCTEIDHRNDNFFLQYAEMLLNDARKKNRPTLPILKAIQKYKKENLIGIERKEPKHLKCNIPIDSKAK